MNYPGELLASAQALLRAEPKSQAALRRAVSTAYYALFHFLIDNTCTNWARHEQRHRLARMFEHRTMASASRSIVAKYKNCDHASTEAGLLSVATSFVQIYQRRHTADYDLPEETSSADVAADIELVEEAFSTWELIRQEQIAQDYLFSLLFKDRA